MLHSIKVLGIFYRITVMTLNEIIVKNEFEFRFCRTSFTWSYSSYLSWWVVVVVSTHQPLKWVLPPKCLMGPNLKWKYMHWFVIYSLLWCSGGVRTKDNRKIAPQCGLSSISHPDYCNNPDYTTHLLCHADQVCGWGHFESNQSSVRWCIKRFTLGCIFAKQSSDKNVRTVNR